MSTTIAALPAFPAPITTPVMGGANPLALAALLRASLLRRTETAALADLSARLRADIGLPPVPETPRLSIAVLCGW